MGRRTINTTKSGKYMNPADQTRKEARKKELKKNKKQRLLVRTAVLKNKDPSQLIDDLEKVDQMEFNPLQQPPPLNEKVLREKRKKLRETLDRVMRLMSREEPDRWVEMKKLQSNYEKKRSQLIAYFESVQTAQQVSVEEIPLPDMPEKIIKTSSGIIKKVVSKSIAKKCPGVPCGPPPTLSSESEDEEDELTKKKTIRFTDQVNVDKFMEDIDTIATENEQVKSIDSQPNAFFNAMPPPTVPILRPPIPPQAVVRLPPGPPPGLPPNLNIGPHFPNLRMPTIVPPPRIVPKPPLQTKPHYVVPGPNLQNSQNTVSAAPQLNLDVPGSTISAKPRIRNLSADITRFVPTALKVKKDDIKKDFRIPLPPPPPLLITKSITRQAPTKDDAYMQFMKEMEGLI